MDWFLSDDTNMSMKQPSYTSGGGSSWTDDFGSFLDGLGNFAGNVAKVKNAWDNDYNEPKPNEQAIRKYENINQKTNGNFLANVDNKTLAIGGLGVLALVMILKD